MDDVLAISCFTIILGITFTGGDTGLAMLLLHAPLEILVAVVFGLAWGLLVTYLPPQPSPSSGVRCDPNFHDPQYYHLMIPDWLCCCSGLSWPCLEVTLSISRYRYFLV